MYGTGRGEPVLLAVSEATFIVFISLLLPLCSSCPSPVAPKAGYNIDVGMLPCNLTAVLFLLTWQQEIQKIHTYVQYGEHIWFNSEALGTERDPSTWIQTSLPDTI